jgi:hypothetical protein
MPDSYGKRQRAAQRARKFAAREERRATRKRERAAREAGVSEGEAPNEAEPEVTETGSDDETESKDTP